MLPFVSFSHNDNLIFQAECADIIVKLDGYGKEEMAAIMQKFNVVSPVTGNKLSGINPAGIITNERMF